MSTPTVIAVTGPPGHDIGPAAAFLGRDLGDGLAVRVVGPDRHPHTSPNPYGGAGAPSGRPLTVELACLPSAWQHPDTNLGVAFPGYVDDRLTRDLAVMDRLGLHPGHRVTVSIGAHLPGQHRSQDHVVVIPEPIELGDLAEIARDSVLRGSGEHRTVLVEAGDGMTFLDAFHTLGLAPWSPHIHRLQLWTVIDLERLRGSYPLSGSLTLAEWLGTVAAAEVDRQGGGLGTTRSALVRLALRNIHLLVHEVTGIGTDGLLGRPEQGDLVPEAAADRLGDIVADVEHRTGAHIGAISTGPGPAGHEQWIDLDPD